MIRTRNRTLFVVVLVGTAGPKWFEIPDRSGEPSDLFEYIFPDVAERRSRLSARFSCAPLPMLSAADIASGDLARLFTVNTSTP